MVDVVSGEQLALWRDRAQKNAMASQISPKEVDWLLQEVAGLDPLSLRLELFKERSRIEIKYSLANLEQLWQNRLQQRCPVQYLVGTTPWRDFQLGVSPFVLIPRPETELLIDLALKAIQESSLTDLGLGNWVDLGTGSGAIAIGLAKMLPDAIIHAVDLSQEALAIAKENAINLELEQRIHFYQGSWWTPLKFLIGKVSGLVSNPPYIPSNLIPQLQPEVANHEPHLALDGGQDGLEKIRYLVKNSTNYLHSGGVFLIEMMAGQAPIVAEMLKAQGQYEKVQIFSDLAGIERFALAYRS